MTTPKDAVKEALAMADWQGLARAFHEGNIQWHANEWADFVKEQRAAGAAAERASIVKYIREKLAGKSYTDAKYIADDIELAASLEEGKDIHTQQ